MADRRMTSKRIAKSSRFLQMPIEAQALYFHSVLEADDDGVVETYPIMRILGIQEDNLKILVAKNFFKPLTEDKVMIISDWLEHNKIRKDRKRNSVYIDLVRERYPEYRLIEPSNRSDVKDNSGRVVHGQSIVSLGKVRLGKDSINTISDYTQEFENFWIVYPKKVGKGKAFDSWKKIKPNKQRQEQIITAIQKQKQTRQWQSDNGQYIPNPATWLNQRRWDDEVEIPKNTVDKF